MSGENTARELLRQGDYTCVVCVQGQVITSRQRGIRPLLEHWETGHLSGASVADKIIGKAAAMLLILGGARKVFGQVMSETACRLLLDAGTEVSWGTLTDHIVNRAGDGLCPMEQAVRDLNNPADAPAALRTALQKLSGQQGASKSE